MTTSNADESDISEQDLATERDSSDIADDGAKADEPSKTMIPKSRLDKEIARRKELETQLNALASEVLSAVPEDFRDLIPEGLSPAQKVAWVKKAKEKGLFDTDTRDVPGTDAGSARTTPRSPNYANLPVHARMARGYGKSS